MVLYQGRRVMVDPTSRRKEIGGKIGIVKTSPPYSDGFITLEIDRKTYVVREYDLLPVYDE